MNFLRIFHSFIIFLVLFILIITVKPSLIYKDNGELKSFGVNQNQNETIMHLGVVSVAIAILAFWITAVNDYSQSLVAEELNDLQNFTDSL